MLRPVRPATTVRTVRDLTVSVYDVVLFATDGSTPARRAFDRALTLARDAGATLHVLSVVDDASLGLFASDDLVSVDEVLRGAAADAVDDAATHAEAAGLDTVRTVRVGTPHREIVAYADDVAADVIVVGTHGRSGLSRALLGSVAARVMRTSPVPVLVVPSG